MKRNRIVIFSSFALFSLLTSCSGSGITHTRSFENKVYKADLNFDGIISPDEENLTWKDAYDTIMNDANSMAKLNKIADTLNIDKNEIKRTSLARYELLHEAEELLMNSGEIMPLYNYSNPYLLKPHIRGMYCSDLGYQYMDKLYDKNNPNNKTFNICFGTVADTYDPAVNTDASTSNIVVELFRGAMTYAKGDIDPSATPGKPNDELYLTKLEEGVCHVKKKLVTKGESDENHINFNECIDLKGENPDDYEGTARYYITIKDGAVWNDNSPITREDFIYAWQRSSSGVYNGSPIGAWNTLFDSIRGFDVWTSIGQQESAEPNDSWSEDAKKNYEELTDKEKQYYKDVFAVNGCAGGMVGLMRDPNNEKTFVVQLINDCDYFDQLLAFPAFFPVKRDSIVSESVEEAKTKILKEHGDWFNKNGQFFTNGPLRIEGEIRNMEGDKGGATLVKAEHYTPGVVTDETIDRLNIKFIDDDTTVEIAYKSNALDFTNRFPTSLIDKYKSDNTDWHTAPQIGSFFYVFNVNDNTFDIKKDMSERDREKLRKIMTLLVNRYDLAENVVKTGVTSADGIVSTHIIESCVPVKDEATGKIVAKRDENGNVVTQDWHTRNLDMFQYLNSNGDYKSHRLENRTSGGFFKTSLTKEEEESSMKTNVNRAIALAKEIDGINFDEKTGKFTNFPHVTIVTNNGTGLEDIAERLQAYYSLWNIDVSIETQEWQSFLVTRKIGDYALARQGWIADYNDPRTYLDLGRATDTNGFQLGKDSWHSSR